MSIKKLTDLAHHLHDIADNLGDIEDLNVADLETLRDTAAEMVTIFEKDEELYMLVAGKSERAIGNDLKLLAVTCHKALPLREQLDNILGAIDWWDFNDTALELSEIMGGLE